MAIGPRSVRIAGLVLASVMLFAGPTVFAAGSGEAVPPPSASLPGDVSEATPEPRPLTATARDNGVRVAMTLDGPLVAGEPARIHTRVKNTGDEPIWWINGSDGLGIVAAMTETAWRQGEPPVSLTEIGEPGFPAPKDLKNELIDESSSVSRILLYFESVSVEGLERPGGGDVGFRERIPPGGVIDFVHEWDGFARLDQDQASVGLTPSGPVRVTGTAYHSLSPDDGQHRTRTRLDTMIVDGWDEGQLHPLEVVDAALADPAFADLIVASDLRRADVGFITYDFDQGRWYTGSCGIPEGQTRAYWRLAGIDPFDGQVLEIIDGTGADSCDPGTWPQGTSVASVPKEAGEVAPSPS